MVNVPIQLKADDQALLALVARHRVVTRPALRRFLPGHSELDRQLRGLVDGGLICASRSLPGNRSAYQLTRKGATAAGAGETVARRLGAQALLKHLGVLCLCAEAPSERFRVEDDQAAAVIGAPCPEGVHVVVAEGDVPRLAWCYVPGVATSLEAVTKRVRQHIYGVSGNPVLQQWVEDRRYVVAVVVDSAARKRAIEKATRSRDRRGREPVAKLAAVWVYHPAGMAELCGSIAPADAPAPKPLPGELWATSGANADTTDMDPAPVSRKSRSRSQRKGHNPGQVPG
ncbi:MAG: hypothetical protein SFY96_01510 [Planctomycetota bacterium]|nr:hypothetical protein [Planctomycetota bacterium]